MPELSDVVVFEVDHPDSQHDKRARVSSLTQTARDVHFVPIDFARDNATSRPVTEDAKHLRIVTATRV